MQTTLGPKLVDLVVAIGKKLGFDTATEVAASESAWVDVVWFDNRIPLISLGVAKPKMRLHPALPVVAFEIELKTGLNAKHIKGSVSNLDNLGAPMGVIVIGNGNFEALRLRNKAHSGKDDAQVERLAMDRVYKWVYAESQPRTRLVVMSENHIVGWARNLGVPVPDARSKVTAENT